MESLLNIGIDWVVVFQGLGNWLTTPMKAFTFLGSEDFFMLVLPAIYWSIDAALGLRVGIILLLSSITNDILKFAFHTPRPYWFSEKVKAFASETGFGLPSGHSQTAVGVWGMLASQIKKKWAWITAILLIFFIGMSRVYLGVHFPTDVLLGWLVGAVLLWLVLKLWEPVKSWAARMKLGKQVTAIFLFSILLILLAMIPHYLLTSSGWQVPNEWNLYAFHNDPNQILPNPMSLAGLFSTTGTLFGLGAGFAWLITMGGFSADGNAMQRVLRYIVGVIGVLAIRYGLKAIFPEGESLSGLTFQYIRYAVIGAWVSAGAPLVFFTLKLASRNPKPE